ncbi:cytochrome c oxidase subunit 2A [Virgibacillus sp. MSP4-1]|uniref:cytochrome c oxidase subunit 2A n=1 Tax=Virgibacillus sp. MSP4-1 TaxID=2700081 RepID=UPI0003A071EA|nr:cytochrome c oxidase subunit 2A [Virgibacillus sp. MSP4-1]QHS24026.1 cytochrome c oxidase subunit 2A [Virgibacillus sp. MSP4-1]
MAQTKVREPFNQQKKDEEKSLKGTMISVGFVAFVIVTMWMGVFWLYMERV